MGGGELVMLAGRGEMSDGLRGAVMNTQRGGSNNMADTTTCQATHEDEQRTTTGMHFRGAALQGTRQAGSHTLSTTYTSRSDSQA